MEAGVAEDTIGVMQPFGRPTKDGRLPYRGEIWVLFDFSASPRQISPIAMNWQKRLIKFQKVIFTSIKKRGEVKILNLICASEGANFELE